MQLSREFIHGKKFDEQWKALGLNDDNMKELQSVLLDNSKAERNNLKMLIARLEKSMEKVN